MGASHIERPEVGRVYLVRKKINGVPSVRFQPAKILAREEIDLPYRSNILTVLWLDDNVESRITEYYGVVKELTERWVQAEVVRTQAEIQQRKFKLNNLYGLIGENPRSPDSGESTETVS